MSGISGGPSYTKNFEELKKTGDKRHCLYIVLAIITIIVAILFKFII